MVGYVIYNARLPDPGMEILQVTEQDGAFYCDEIGEKSGSKGVLLGFRGVGFR